MNSIFKFFSGFNLQKALLLLASPFLAMWHNYKIMAVGLLVVMILDLRTGIQVYCKKNNVKIKVLKPKSWGYIQSAGLRRTMSKLKDYLGVIIAAYFFGHFILKEPLDIFGYNLTELMMVVLGAIELWSIGENFKELRGYNIFDYIKKLIINRDAGAVLDDITTKE